MVRAALATIEIGYARLWENLPEISSGLLFPLLL